ncbi:MAG TPA: SET domain-containing protein [Ignavibacteriaceae bacterium]|nr:SET domain-containing protein [Ignavibacteriaceae bacterium]
MNVQFKDFEEFIYVKSSGIHGAGIFTSVDIPANSKIMDISGEIISGDECERREEEEDNVYIFWYDEETYIDTANTKKIKYINHNCEYNCDIEEADEFGLELITVRGIKAGEEITIDYGYEEIYDDCNCRRCNVYEV